MCQSLKIELEQSEGIQLKVHLLKSEICVKYFGSAPPYDRPLPYLKPGRESSTTLIFSWSREVKAPSK